MMLKIIRSKETSDLVESLQWLHHPCEIYGDSLNNIRCEASRYFREKEGIS
jgi:hypothetical protein